MPWNPSPKVADCREIARKWKHQMVIVIGLSPVGGRIEMVTYGETRTLCDAAKKLGDVGYDAVYRKYADEVIEVDAHD